MTMPPPPTRRSMLVLLAAALLPLVGFAPPARAADAATTAPATTRSASARPINQNLPTLFLVGDSTVNTGTKGQRGWGDPIADLFDLGKINVVNRARGGRSSRTFQTEGLWDKVLAEAKPGDFVLIQFGHNDGGAINDESRARGSIRGTGEETEAIDNLITKKHEVVHTFGWYMRKYVDDAKAKGITPILCAPIPRVPKEKVTGPAGEPRGYRLWAAEVAKAKDVGFIDLEALILKRYMDMTPEQIKEKYFTPADGTHTSDVGARLNAEAVVEGIRNLPDSPLVKYLKAE